MRGQASNDIASVLSHDSVVGYLLIELLELRTEPRCECPVGIWRTEHVDLCAFVAVPTDNVVAELLEELADTLFPGHHVQFPFVLLPNTKISGTDCAPPFGAQSGSDGSTCYLFLFLQYMVFPK